METNQYLIDHYSNYDEDNRFASKHGSVEFLTTMRYIEKYIKPGDRVLEVGAATGRYSHALARQGHAVDAVELVEHNIKVFKQNTQSNENITITQGNAMDLSTFPDNKYDTQLSQKTIPGQLSKKRIKSKKIVKKGNGKKSMIIKNQSIHELTNWLK